MKIGIVTESFKSFYSSGCNQQAFYLYECLSQSSKLSCALFSNSIKDDEHIFDNKLFAIKKNEDLFENLDVIIHVSGHIPNEQLFMYKKPIKIWYNCGNMYKIYQEQLSLGAHGYVNEENEKCFWDVLWTIPNYKNNIGFLQSIHKTEIHSEIVPYIWGTKLVDSSLDKKYFYNPNDRTSSYNYVLIAEPNLQTTKTCLIPLMICQKLYKTMKNLKVILLAKPTNVTSCQVISNMNIIQNGVVELYDRLKFTAVIENLKSQNNTFVVLSHQDCNPMNYLHLETLYLGYPLLHNVKNLNNAGYYYETIEEGSFQLKCAFNNHSQRFEEYKHHANYELYKYSPKNKDNLQKYISLLEKAQNTITHKSIINKFPINLYRGIKFILCYKKDESKELWKEILHPHYLFFMSEGFEVEIKEINNEGEDFEEKVVYIIYGYHLFEKLPPKYIIFQTEQLLCVNNQVLMNTIKKYYLKAEAILELSTKHLTLLKKVNDNVYYFPVSYFKEHKYFLPASSGLRTKELLWIGNASMAIPRRISFLKELEASKIKINYYPNNDNYWKNTLWGNEKRRLFLESKILLDIGKCEPKEGTTNIIKFQHAFMGKCLVISEKTDDPYINSQIEKFVVFVKSPKEMIAQIKYYLKNEDERMKKTNKAYEWFVNTSYKDFIIDK